MEREDTGRHDPSLSPREQGDEAAAGSQEQVDVLRATLEEAEREKSQFKGLLQRVQADFANYRKRVDSEREEQQQIATGRILLRLIAIMDDFERALARAPSGADEGVRAQQAWTDGIKLIYRNLQALLESEGVASIDAKGRPFDPSAHEAVLMQETAEAPEGTVVAIARPGYKHKDRILRPAQVVVARAPQPGQSNGAGTDQGERSNE